MLQCLPPAVALVTSDRALDPTPASPVRRLIVKFCGFFWSPSGGIVPNRWRRAIGKQIRCLMYISMTIC
ncbi:hypothetical protein GUJ93_ZPchr0006g42045 [Zizania palustris]|uniref:Uncharacterized protein n=1 Tax=Zizania palustris TaxID=103762 RepID=A0A8J5VJ10_ZIZPA|nr:hypothetical protein GUJ93_ZPchr0006g42045 [Zizania palustris]